MIVLLRAPAVLMAISCLAAAPVAGAQQILRVGGTGSAVAAMTRLGVAAQAQGATPPFRVLPSLGSTGAIQAVADGAIDVGVIGRRLRDGERSPALSEREVARTPFVFAVGPRVAATTLTTDQLVAIYLGTQSSWPDGLRIRPVVRPVSDVDTEMLRSISPEVSAAVDAAARRPGMLLAVTNSECNELLARSAGAIGPSTLLQIRAEPHPLRALPWNGAEPTLENLATGRYPLVKSIHVVYRKSASEGVRRFLSFLASPPGRALLLELGALPVDFAPAD